MIGHQHWNESSPPSGRKKAFNHLFQRWVGAAGRGGIKINSLVTKPRRQICRHREKSLASLEPNKRGGGRRRRQALFFYHSLGFLGLSYLLTKVSFWCDPRWSAPRSAWSRLARAERESRVVPLWPYSSENEKKRGAQYTVYISLADFSMNVGWLNILLACGFFWTTWNLRREKV